MPFPDELYFVVFSILAGVIGLAAAIANAVMGLARIKQRMAARAVLRFLNALACLYMAGLYSYDVLVSLGPGRTISLYARPGVVLMLALFLANVVANWESRWTGR